VRVDSLPRPGVRLIAAGALLIGLSTARLATGWAPGGVLGPHAWLLFEFGICAAGAALLLGGVPGCGAPRRVSQASPGRRSCAPT